MSQSPSFRRHLLAALTGALLLLGALVATARAETYGGLGPLGAFKAGTHGGHLEVNPRGHYVLGVAPDGSSYIAEIETVGTPGFRIQKLGANGEFLAEVRVDLATSPHQLDGVAIDSEEQRLYVLVVDESNPELEQYAAAELYAFSTEAKEEKLEPAAGTKAGLLAGAAVFDPSSAAAGVPLLDPHGIAVDPTTHDVVILGQQDVSTKKGPGEEQLRAAVQRVHTQGANAGKLGPRYVDGENCLDGGAEIEAEPACAEVEGVGEPSSPFVSPGGRVFGVRLGELWEIPASEGISESFASGSDLKVYEVKPKRLFTVGRGHGIEGENGIVDPAGVEEQGQGSTLAFLPTGADEGKIYLDAEIAAEEGLGNRSYNRGAVVLDYSESGGTPAAREIGWTAGQNETSESETCVIPSGGHRLWLELTTADV